MAEAQIDITLIKIVPMNSSNKFSKKESILQEVEVCLDLVNRFSRRLQQNRQKMVELKSIKVDSQDPPSRTQLLDSSIIRSNSSLMSLYRLNFPISENEAVFLLKQLVVRLAAKRLALGAVIDLQGQVFQSQIVELMLRKLSYDNTYRLRKTVRYFFQITPFDNERTRDRIQLIDSVEQKLQQLHLLIDIKVEQQTVRKAFTKEEQVELVKTLTADGVKYDLYPLKEAISILEKAIGPKTTCQLLISAVEDKRSLTKLNPFELLGIPVNLIPTYFKKQSARTVTTNSESFLTMEEEFTFEDCEIECVNYETMFGIGSKQ